MVIGQTYNSDSIIGKLIKIEKFEVAQYDFPNRMNWKDAKAECAKLGKGWRLPTKDELNVMYKKKNKIGGFANYYYWSSTEYNNNFAWVQNFDDGGQYDDYKGNKYDVRAVRAF
jgi:formylglycine-generating enzyme required for sulfatase activity